MTDDPDARRLRQIADALGIPVERLSEDPPVWFDGSRECLRLWAQIRTEEGRRRALACIREVVATER